jgi:8-oxo-dGTP diphosphatase
VDYDGKLGEETASHLTEKWMAGKSASISFKTECVEDDTAIQHFMHMYINRMIDVTKLPTLRVQLSKLYITRFFKSSQQLKPPRFGKYNLRAPLTYPFDTQASNSPTMSTQPTQSPPSNNIPIVLVVAAALVRPSDNKLFLAQRPQGKAMAGLWEFPGGKVDAGEIPEDALIRELKEELGITIKKKTDLKPITFASHTYADSQFHLLMPLYLCSSWEGGDPIPQEGQNTVWVDAEDLEGYKDKMPAADVPLIPIVTAFLLSFLTD